MTLNSAVCKMEHAAWLRPAGGVRIVVSIVAASICRYDRTMTMSMKHHVLAQRSLGPSRLSVSLINSARVINITTSLEYSSLDLAINMLQRGPRVRLHHATRVYLGLSVKLIDAQSFTVASIGDCHTMAARLDEKCLLPQRAKDMILRDIIRPVSPG